eukprot:359828-Chlamydomonas_euryale.AAC.2
MPCTVHACCRPRSYPGRPRSKHGMGKRRRDSGEDMPGPWTNAAPCAKQSRTSWGVHKRASAKLGCRPANQACALDPSCPPLTLPAHPCPFLTVPNRPFLPILGRSCSSFLPRPFLRMPQRTPSGFKRSSAMWSPSWHPRGRQGQGGMVAVLPEDFHYFQSRRLLSATPACVTCYSPAHVHRHACTRPSPHECPWL